MSNRSSSVVRKIETAADDVWKLISDTRQPETWIPFLDSRRLSSEGDNDQAENDVRLYHPSSVAAVCDDLIAFTVDRVAPDDRIINFRLTSGFLQVFVQVAAHEAKIGTFLEVSTHSNTPPQDLTPALESVLQEVSRQMIDNISVICRALYAAPGGEAPRRYLPTLLRSRHPEMSVAGVQRVSLETDFKEVFAAGRPVIFSHYGESNNAYPRLQDLSWWNDQFGEQTVSIQDMEDAAYLPGNTYVRTTISMLISMLASNPNGSRFALYETRISEILGLSKYLSLQKLVPEEYTTHVPYIWIGSPHVNSTLHQDGRIVDRTGKDPKKTHNLNFQIAGRKHFILAHPNQTEYLYPVNRENQDGAPTSQIDFFAPLNFDVFPEVRHAALFEGILEPGEVLYVPRSWWHAFYSLENTINSNVLFSPYDF